MLNRSLAEDYFTKSHNIIITKVISDRIILSYCVVNLLVPKPNCLSIYIYLMPMNIINIEDKVQYETLSQKKMEDAENTVNGN